MPAYLPAYELVNSEVLNAFRAHPSPPRSYSLLLNSEVLNDLKGKVLDEVPRNAPPGVSLELISFFHSYHICIQMC